MVTCPHCGEAGITWWQKVTLGPAGARVCRRCGQRVGVGWGANVVLLLPAFALVGAIFYVLDGWIRMAAFAALLVVVALIQLVWPPLRKK